MCSKQGFRFRWFPSARKCSKNRLYCGHEVSLYPVQPYGARKAGGSPHRPQIIRCGARGRGVPSLIFQRIPFSLLGCDRLPFLSLPPSPLRPPSLFPGCLARLRPIHEPSAG